MPVAATTPLRTQHSPVAGARLLGIGAARPTSAVDAATLGAPFGRSAEWIEARTGIREVRRLRPGQPLLPLACSAGRDALARAGVAAGQVELVLFASCSAPGRGMPLAAEVGRQLAPDAATLDLNCACAGFCYCVATADALIRTGRAGTVLVVAAEQMSTLLNPDDLGTSIIFGDGAGAAVLDRATDGEVHVGPVVWGSDGAQADLIEITDPTQGMRMQGQSVFRWAVDEMHTVAAAACERAGVSTHDIEVFVPHQANLRIIDAMVRRLGMDKAVVATDVVSSGNTSAASIPLALCALETAGQLHGGELALAIGFGAGLSYAAQVLRLP